MNVWVVWDTECSDGDPIMGVYFNGQDASDAYKEERYKIERVKVK